MGLLFALFAAPFRWLPFCCHPGAVAGALAGLMFAMVQIDNPAATLTAPQQVLIGLAFGAVALVLVLVLFGWVLRYGVGQIFWPALVNALATGVLTVMVDAWLAEPAISALAGLLVGILVGFLLCRACRFAAGGKGAPDGQT